MPTPLPAVTLFNGSSTTEGDQKTFIANLYLYLAGLLGTDGDPATAKAVLGASAFPAGTKMLFAQAAAPTGWTKDTTHNDKALRVVSGSGGGSGGSVAFSTLFGRTAVDGTSLSEAQLAAHRHGATRTAANAGYLHIGGNSAGQEYSDYAGSGSAHTHGLDLRVAYLDVIVATKD